MKDSRFPFFQFLLFAFSMAFIVVSLSCGSVHSLVDTSCKAALFPFSVSFGPDGGDGQLDVTLDVLHDSCQWSLSTNVNWIKLSTTSGTTESRNITYSVLANPSSSPRTGIIQVTPSSGISQLTVNQSGAGCEFQLLPESLTFGKDGGNGIVTVKTGSDCFWDASTSDSWITITSAPNRQGQGNLTFSVAKNTGPPRKGVIHIADKKFIVKQNGTTPCSYTVAPTVETFQASGGSSTISVSTQSNCSWTAKSNDPWIHITSGSSGTGPGGVGYKVDANSGAARNGTMTIAGKTVTIQQAGK